MAIITEQQPMVWTMPQWVILRRIPGATRIRRCRVVRAATDSIATADASCPLESPSLHRS